MRKCKWTTRVAVTTAGMLAGMLLAGCELEKSSTPLSPTVAGPIPGVNITAPQPLEPANGTELLTEQQPIELVFANASSNSERPFWYELDVAVDAQFSSRVYAVPKLNPGEGDRTRHRLPSALESGRSYYWRIRALDGANTGPYSGSATFQVIVPVVIDPPVPVSPVNGSTTGHNAPEFVVVNGKVAGPAGEVFYRFQVANDVAFTSVAAVVTVGRNPSGSTSMSLGTLPYDRTFFWRAQGSDNVNTGPWSAVQTFRTPSPPPPPPPPKPTPAPSPAPSPSPSPGPRPSGGPRRPDGGPLPYAFPLVQDVAGEYPGALHNSCQEEGGSWDFMDLVVDRLRAVDDTRWGYNWKRGFHQGYSMDVIDYHYGAGPDEGSPAVYIVDIIGGHCGGNPSPVWNDVTPFGAGAWTGRGRF